MKHGVVVLDLLVMLAESALQRDDERRISSERYKREGASKAYSVTAVVLGTATARGFGLGGLFLVVGHGGCSGKRVR